MCFDDLLDGVAGRCAVVWKVFEQVADGFGRVGLVGADDAGRAALDPAGDVLAGDASTVRCEDATAVIGDDVSALVERDAVQRDTLVTDGAKDHADGERLVLTGPGDAPRLVQPGLLQAEALDTVGAEDRGGGTPEADVDAAGTIGRLAGPAAQHLDIAADMAVAFSERGAGRVEVHVLGADVDGGVRELTQFTGFLGGELGLRGPPAADHVNAAYTTVRQGLD